MWPQTFKTQTFKTSPPTDGRRPCSKWRPKQSSGGPVPAPHPLFPVELGAGRTAVNRHLGGSAASSRKAVVAPGPDRNQRRVSPGSAEKSLCGFETTQPRQNAISHDWKEDHMSHAWQEDRVWPHLGC